MEGKNSQIIVLGFMKLFEPICSLYRIWCFDHLLKEEKNFGQKISFAMNLFILLARMKPKTTLALATCRDKKGLEI